MKLNNENVRKELITNVNTQKIITNNEKPLLSNDGRQMEHYDIKLKPSATHYKKNTEMLNSLKKLIRFSYEDQFL